MKTLSLLAAVLAVLIIGILGVNVIWKAGLIDVYTTMYISGALGMLLLFSPIAFFVAVIIRRTRADERRRDRELVSIGQCMNCGGRMGHHHWTCKRHGEVFCSEHCYYEHIRNTHRRHE
jgi:hypothetical protein